MVHDIARDERLMCCTLFAHYCTLATWAYVLEIVRGAVTVKNLELRLSMRSLLLSLLLSSSLTDGDADWRYA